jgi:hypothetical protein
VVDVADRQRRAHPTLQQDGSVTFGSSDLYIPAPKILNTSGLDISPNDLKWKLKAQNGGWLLQLELKDANLPVPYIIDPAISYRSGTSNILTVAGTTLTLSKPSGVEPADLLLAEVSVEGGTGVTITAPSGWTLVRRDDNGTNLAQAIYRHVVAAGDPTSWDWTFGSHFASGGIVAYSGVNTTTPIDTSSESENGTSNSTVVAPAITTSAANELLVVFYGMEHNKNFSTPTNMTERYDAFNAQSGASTGSAADDETRASAGSTGTRTSTATGAGFWIAQSIALKLTNDATAPSISIETPTAVTNPTGQYYDSASGTQWVKGGGSGSFSLTATASDAESGVKSVAFPSVAGTSGWSGSTGGTDTASPYASPANYSWTAGAGSPGTASVTATNNADLTASDTITITADSTAPTGVSASVASTRRRTGRRRTAASSSRSRSARARSELVTQCYKLPTPCHHARSRASNTVLQARSTR